MIRLTFVTPTYNQSEYVSECIESILPQLNQTIEYVVVNDGSTDETSLVLSKYHLDSRLKIITQNNCGQVKTLNNIWGASTAEYLGYLSSDDVLLPGAINTLLNFLDRNPEVVAVYPDFYQINKNSEIITSVVNGNFDRRLLFEQLICQPGPCTIFRRSAFLDAGEWRSDLRITPDLEFWSRLCIVGDLVRYPQFLANYRVHEDSQSTGVMPFDRANEILKIPKIFSRTLNNSGLNYSYLASVASACILAGHNHYKGGRPYLTVVFLAIGFGIRVTSAFARSFFELIKRK